MATADDIRDGITSNLSAISGLRIVDRLTGQIQPPVAAVGFPLPGERQAFGDVWRWTGQIVLYVTQASQTGADSQLASYLDTSGAKSLIAQGESDPTLGGVVDEFQIVGASDIDSVEDGRLWQVTFDYEVWV